MNKAFVIADLKNFVKNTIIRLKYRPIKVKKKNIYYCIFQPGKKHTGIADRLKTVILQYDLAKASGYDFKLFWENPFKLSDYFVPKKEWTCSLNDLEYSLFDTKIISEVITWRKQSLLKPNKQYHCYRYAGGVQPSVLPHTGQRWGELFAELFEPSERLLNAYFALNVKEKSYVSVHFRFVNALEKFEHTYFDNHLETQEEKDALVARCKNAVMEVQKEYLNQDVYVFSDSKVFLDSLSDMSVKVLDSSNIGHVSENKSDDINLKSFLDMYFMSKSSAVYRMQAPEIYSYSGYAMLAANMGNIPFYNKKV